MTNPFKPNTTSHHDWEVLKDLNWHCTKCELKSAQAKTWQVWRQKWIQLDTDEKGNLYKRMHCPTCEATTVHRKLKSLEIGVSGDNDKLIINIKTQTTKGGH